MKIKVEYILEIDKKENTFTEEEIKIALERDIRDEFGKWVKSVSVCVENE